MHTQVPFSHLVPLGQLTQTPPAVPHALSHVPGWQVLFWQQPEQLVGLQTHLPCTHCCPCWQQTPHAPQFSKSSSRLAHLPNGFVTVALRHGTFGGGQVHVPSFGHTAPLGQQRLPHSCVFGQQTLIGVTRPVSIQVSPEQHCCEPHPPPQPEQVPPLARATPASGPRAATPAADPTPPRKARRDVFRASAFVSLSKLSALIDAHPIVPPRCGPCRRQQQSSWPERAVSERKPALKFLNGRVEMHQRVS
jgi:hypothetical protein